MWTALATLLGLVATGVTYWIATAGERKKKRLLAQKLELEHDLDQAMATRDPLLIATLRRRMQQLADEAGGRL